MGLGDPGTDAAFLMAEGIGYLHKLASTLSGGGFFTASSPPPRRNTTVCLKPYTDRTELGR